jgi:hypothetical protein
MLVGSHKAPSVVVLFLAENGVWCRNSAPPTVLDAFDFVVKATVRGITYHTNSSLRRNSIGAPAVRATFLTPPLCCSSSSLW